MPRKKRPREESGTPPATLAQRRELFLDELGVDGDVARALTATGLSLNAVSYRRRRDPDFDAGWELAMERAGRHRVHLVFLDVFGKTGNQSEALRLSGMTRADLLARKRDDPGFAEMFEEARAVGNDALEAEARRRGVHGVEETMINGGGPVYHRDARGRVLCDELGAPIPVTRRVYSDKMLELLLRANNREKFGEAVKVDHEVRGGVLLLGAKAPTQDEWEERMRVKRLERAGRILENGGQG